MLAPATDGLAEHVGHVIIGRRVAPIAEATARTFSLGEEARLDLWATSHVFLPGHRLRVEISSSNFPRFDRNLNTGEDQATGRQWQRARQTVFHDPHYPSHIVLPVIPR